MIKSIRDGLYSYTTREPAIIEKLYNTRAEYMMKRILFENNTPYEVTLYNHDTHRMEYSEFEKRIKELI